MLSTLLFRFFNLNVFEKASKVDTLESLIWKFETAELFYNAEKVECYQWNY